jgi:uncharacterized repeat protein (TIGR04138 family)
MSLRDEVPKIIAGDPRYSIEAYAFVLEALGQARSRKQKAERRSAEAQSSAPPKRRSKAAQAGAREGGRSKSGHVTGGELCEAVRKLALRQYGLLAATVLNHWGIRSTSDIGEIVYHMIAAGGLEKTNEDSRADFDNVFDFDTALRPKLNLGKDDGGAS